MKKSLLITLALLAYSAIAGAATISVVCPTDPQGFAGGNGTGSVICPSFSSLAIAGTFVSTTLQYVGDFVLNTSVNPPVADTVNIVFTPTAAGFAGGTVAMANAAGSFLKTNNSPQLDGPNSNAAAALSFTVNEKSTATGTGVQSANGSVFETFTYTPTVGSPEPATLCLIGLGLIGLGIRRKLA